MSSTITLFLFIISCLVLASDSLQDEITNNVNTHNTNNHRIVEVGNTNNEHYNFGGANYQPTQVTQVVFGKPKLAKTRKGRPPTKEELAIKHRILHIWTRAQYETGYSSIYLRHLGRILDALNPKYISTQRVKNVAFADPNNPDVHVVPPESEHSDQIAAYVKAGEVAWPAFEPLKLVGKVESSPEMIEKLAELETYFKKFVDWDDEFVQSLKKIDNRQLTHVHSAFKHLIETLSHQHSVANSLAEMTGTAPGHIQQYVLQGRAPASRLAPAVKAASPSATAPNPQPRSEHYYKPSNQQPQVQPQPQQQLRRTPAVNRVRRNMIHQTPNNVPRVLLAA